MTIDLLLPSQYLPILRPIPTVSTLLNFLNRLQKLINPTNIIINLVDSTAIDSDVLEEFERNFIIGWLNRSLAIVSRKVGEGGEGGDEWIELLDGIACLLSSLSGHSASGPSTSTYLLPISNPLHPTLSIIIQETTLLSSSTGFRTWGAAPLLSRAITLNPESFFPSPSTTNSTKLRILELGSGTGLCSITTIKMLELMGKEAEVVVTDYEAEILENLRCNLNLNSISSTSSSGVEVKVEHLDWSSYLHTSSSTSPISISSINRYPIILASDVIFESDHTELIHSVISSLLSFPNSSFPNPTFHIILPLRYTHSIEHDGFDTLFSGDDTREEEGRVGVEDEEGRKWRLRTKSRETLRGQDGFGSKGSGKEDSEYWLYRIGWESMSSISILEFHRQR